MKDRHADLGFSLAPGIGPKRYNILIEYFGSSSDAWEANEQQLTHLLGKVCADKFSAFKKEYVSEKAMLPLTNNGISFIGFSDPLYPHLLRAVEGAPIVLYTIGHSELLKQEDLLVAVVGTRKITGYGKQVTESITETLVDHGCIIVSGLALGVDTVAHETALKGRGKTIAVLGSGIDTCHPESNQLLYKEIVSNDGLILSEYPPGTAPNKGTFPARNRIIAGISRAIVVTEGSEDSGSLITAEIAIRYERSVFAVPGPITSSLSKGPNLLLKKGAALATDAHDILMSLNIHSTPDKQMFEKITGDSPEENVIITLLDHEPLLFDEVVKRSGCTATETGTILSILEMKGYIQIDTTGRYTLVRYRRFPH